jgi:glycosyltransferase involved in cell wall biosynthesis
VRVLVVNWQDRTNPQAGGAEIHIHEVFGRLAATGVDVTLLASAWRGADRLAEVDGIRVVRTGSRYGFGLAAPRAGRRLLRSSRFDVVVEALNKVPVFAPLWANVPVVLLVHHLFGSTAFREASLPLASLTWLLERPIGRLYRGVPVQAISRSTSEDLQERGLRAADIEVIYPGVDLGFFHPSAEVERARDPTFLYLGRLKRYKGVDIVVRALSRLAGEGERMRLLIGGRGEWEPNLRHLVQELGVEDRVEFLGFVSEERKRDLFRTSWANIYPSPKEGWGITNLEAAACGTPAIASDSPGLRESVLHERTGLLVPHGDVNAMADSMRRLASQAGEVERLGSGALAFARSFTWDRTAEATLDHLRRAAGRPDRTANGERSPQSSGTG